MPEIDRYAPYDIEIEVLDSDIDVLGHVNNTVYLRWIQDAATRHWDVIATDEEKRSLFWVVARHEIDYKRPTFKTDDVIARTWLGAPRGTLMGRHTEILRPSDEKVLARALTLWCPMDAKTGKPVRLPESRRTRFSTTP